MDELILQRIAIGLYATVPTTESSGLLFMPESDLGLASLALEGDITEAGQWLVWSNGPLVALSLIHI